MKQHGGPKGDLGGKEIRICGGDAFECSKLYRQVANGGAFGCASADGKAGALSGEAAQKLIAAAATDDNDLGGLVAGVVAQFLKGARIGVC